MLTEPPEERRSSEKVKIGRRLDWLYAYRCRSWSANPRS